MWKYNIKNLFHTMLSDKLKNAFTMIEISVILLILSIFIAGILISKSVYDEAQVFQIIAEYNSIKNNVNTFYSNYGYFPGNADQTTCQFNSQTNIPIFGATNINLCSSLNTISGNGINFATTNLASKNIKYKSSTNGVGIGYNACTKDITTKEKCNNTIAGSNASSATFSTTSLIYPWKILQIVTKNGFNILAPNNLIFYPIDYSTKISYNEVALFYPKSQVNSDNYWTFDNQTSGAIASSTVYRTFRGGRYEFYQASATSSIYNNFYFKSQITLFYNAPASCDSANAAIGCVAAKGAVSGYIAYKVDSKIDDGLPSMGNVISTKPGIAQILNGGSDIANLSKYCTSLSGWNGGVLSAATVDSAKYNFVSNPAYALSLKYGCNISFLLN